LVVPFAKKHGTTTQSKNPKKLLLSSLTT